MAEGHVLEGARLNLARTVDAPRIVSQERTDRRLRRAGRRTAAILVRTRGMDGAQTQRRNRIQKKANQMAFGKPFMKRWGKLRRPVDGVRKEVLAHALKLNRKPLLPLLPPSRIYARQTPGRFPLCVTSSITMASLQCALSKTCAARVSASASAVSCSAARACSLASMASLTPGRTTAA